jgi:hypothetical protein
MSPIDSCSSHKTTYIFLQIFIQIECCSRQTKIRIINRLLCDPCEKKFAEAALISYIFYCHFLSDYDCNHRIKNHQTTP